MGTPDLAERWTRDEVLALSDDGNRYELLDGDPALAAGSVPSWPGD